MTRVTLPDKLKLYVGRRSIDKGYDVWLAACADVATRDESAFFITVGMEASAGTGKCLGDRAALIASRRLVKFNYLSPKTLWALMAEAMAVVLHSLFECTPNLHP